MFRLVLNPRATVGAVPPHAATHLVRLIGESLAALRAPIAGAPPVVLHTARPLRHVAHALVGRTLVAHLDVFRPLVVRPAAVER